MVCLILLGAGGNLSGSTAPSGHGTNRAIAGSQLPVSTMGESAPTPEDEPLGPGAAPRIGLGGDEISPALATYGIDRDGNLFEIHSPQTEEPRLGSPIG